MKPLFLLSLMVNIILLVLLLTKAPSTSPQVTITKQVIKNL